MKYRVIITTIIDTEDYPFFAPTPEGMSKLVGTVLASITEYPALVPYYVEVSEDIRRNKDVKS